ncbi:MAG: hypothetical protein II149_01455 [Clostridia bacterium]|nr:hypothetical protein [Clostridia bacterium]MBQ6172763.1 hypothetical protein [Clostridia bacterium]
MNYSTILKCLREYFGAECTDDGMMPLIEKWREWYSGTSEGFHKIFINNGLSTVSREMFRLNMAKRVCEDWANLLLNEKTLISISGGSSEEFVCGKNGKGGVLGENAFHTAMNRLVEKSFALGTGAVICCIDGIMTDRNGNIVQAKNAEIRFDYADAGSIFPVSWSGDSVTEAAFAKQTVENGEPLLYIQAHLIENGEYVIYNRCFSERDGLREEPLPEGTAPALKTGSSLPWFAMIRPNTVNSLVPSSPMGISVFSDAIDIIKGIDLCYDSLNMEFVLGKKMVFLRRDLLEKDGDGNYYAPQDINRQLFMYLGDKAIDGDMLPQEFNPMLRVNDHVRCIQEQMNYLSSKCGFGERYYRFDSSNVVTATQINSENSTLYRCVKKHEILLEKSLETVIRTVLYIGRAILCKNVSEKDCINIIFDDSVIEDKAAMMSRDLELVKAKIMAPYEFRVKYFGENKATAKRIIAEECV